MYPWYKHHVVDVNGVKGASQCSVQSRLQQVSMLLVVMQNIYNFADATILIPNEISYKQAAPVFCAGYTVRGA